MKIYVESNFILELALEQEQSHSCEAILEMCETGQGRLVIPAFCVAEPYQTLGKRANDRLQLKNSLANELKLLSRTRAYQQDILTLQDVSTILVRSGEQEHRRLNNVFKRTLQIAELIPLEQSIISSATTFQAQFDLKPADAIVYASIWQHVSKTDCKKACFLNRNSKDFDDPDIVTQLETYHCKMLFRFDHGLQYIRTHILEQQIDVQAR